MLLDHLCLHVPCAESQSLQASSKPGSSESHSAQGPQAGLSYSKGSAAQVIDLAAGSTTPAVSHVPATGHSEGLSSSVRANKRCESL